MFATGIENSIPTIDNGRTRVDQMEASDHYRRWREDFDCVEDLGIHGFGPPLHKTFAPGQYDWEFCDLTMSDLKRRDITPIVDLCHFGVPDWIGNFQNPDFPHLFATYAGGLRGALPWVRLHAGQRDVHLRRLLGEIWLVERAAEDRPLFVTASSHRPRQRPGDDGNPQAPAGRDFHPERLPNTRRQPGGDRAGGALNARRFLSLDLNYGRRVDSGMYEYLWTTA